jgi:hypothetical protein
MIQQAAATTVISAEAAQLAAQHQLGTPTAVYKAGIPTFELVMSVISLGLGTWVGIGVGTANLNSGSPIAGVILFLLIGSWGLHWPIRYLLNLGLRVYVCTEGLLRVKGSSTLAIRWDQIESVKRLFTILRFSYGLPVTAGAALGGIGAGIASRLLLGVFPTYRVYRTDGTQMKLTDVLLGVKGLGVTVCSEANRFLLPRALASVRAGSSVSFGPLVVTQQGLIQGKKMLAWSECGGVEITKVAIIIKKQGGGIWYTRNLSHMPNHFVLAGLIAAMKSGQA